MEVLLKVIRIISNWFTDPMAQAIESFWAKNRNSNSISYSKKLKILMTIFNPKIINSDDFFKI